MREYFHSGSRPTAEHFEHLIESTFNKADDKLDIDPVSGLMIYATKSRALMSIYEDGQAQKAKWMLNISEDNHGLRIDETKRLADQDNNEPTLFIKEGKMVGIGTANPLRELDVNGYIAARGRIGNYLQRRVKADGKWYNVFKKNLHGSNAFEIMAHADGGAGSGKYALAHAIAISTYGKSNPSIRKTVAHFGRWWNKIDFRWVSKKSVLDEPEKSKWWKNPQVLLEQKGLEYNLQIRTKSDYGAKPFIDVNVSVLWNKNYKHTNDSGTANGTEKKSS